MFEKWFAKYARAVSDNRERERLYKKFRAKTVVSIIFSVLCIAMIALAYVLEPYIEQEWAFTIMTVIIFAWIGFGIANMCLWISFRRTYNLIIHRSAYSGEMPEVTAYRQKVVDDKKSTFKKLWWAWVIFGICIVGFIVCMVMETIQNPDGEEFGVWEMVSFFVLLAGSLTIAFAYIIHNIIQQQQGKTFEQQWNEMWNLWVQELVDSPYAELMTYQSEVNNGGHAQYFDNVSGTSDLQKEMSALETILPPQLRETLKKAYEAQLVLDEKDDENAEETLRQCDEEFYKNEEEINRILEEYATKIEL